ncbi:amidohydrolase family protein [Candidatus Palauibacter polyketidifaciens]|uniref:amidohydrolase family protein n=1 Tax=Candidatus Palauibacter polyketidifaciens TaxID=3056740 RepID=UPI00239FD100|nr:amidohydrolase family protein [Candidatus Palauibacter polyketidifaciens]MDE2721586.1 amidohydrolase family protein [Candidatus Palauibacter polyketidifaciens]
MMVSARRSVRMTGVLALTIFATLLGVPAAAAQEGMIALVGGQLLDGYEVPPIHHAAVVIEGNRIVAVGPASEIEIPPDAEVIDTRGKTMMPGMVDAHVHIMILGHGDYSRWFPWFEGNDDLVYETSAKQLLAAGVTAGVDLAAPMSSLAFRDRVNRNEVPGPRLLASGPWVTRYAWGFLPAELRVLHRTPEEAAERTRMLIDAGVDVIKTWIGTTEEDMRAIKAVAGPAGVPIHCHVYAEEVVWGAIRGGCDVLQHAGSGGSVPPYSQELVDHIAMEGIPVVQTISHRIWIYPATVEFPERLWDPDIIDSFPEPIREQVLNSYTKDDFWRKPYFRTTPRQIRNSEQAGRQFIDADAVMAMGTDTGSPLNFHAESAWREVSAFVDMGMTEIEAISAATKVSAEVLGLSETGTIEPGKLADIIVVDGNPLFDINVLGYVTDVIKDGIIYKRDGVPVWETGHAQTSASGR